MGPYLSHAHCTGSGPIDYALNLHGRHSPPSRSSGYPSYSIRLRFVGEAAQWVSRRSEPPEIPATPVPHWGGLPPYPRIDDLQWRWMGIETCIEGLG
jgi:hypothetical protein